MALLLGGCSTKNGERALARLKTAGYNAVSDPVTWAPALTAGALYATPYDDKITSYFMDHHWTGADKNGDIARDVTAVLTIGTAALVPEKRWQERGIRVAVEGGTLGIANLVSSTLKTNIDKETPDGRNDYAIGSHHALPPFAGSAMTRRNVTAMDLPDWAGYGLVGISYLSASASALSRVEDGGHSFADQLLNASIGNFVGLFFHDLFLLGDTTSIQTAITQDQAFVGIALRY